jgi:2-polyprenyl-6-hydroxyphenyl methylase/3-demethylubiquinone-9 3-methyltransferase
LSGRTFLDTGSGSGLFSLAARILGADVTSFDFDPMSVACTAELRRRYRPDDPQWRVAQGSVLDRQFLTGLGTFDIVYAWGVLHHTGDLWTAVANTESVAAADATIFLSVYNDQGRASRRWTSVKRRYNTSGPVGRKLLLAASTAYLRYPEPIRWLYREARRLPQPVVVRERGMDRRHDLIDWVGGWPFEVATPDAVFDFFRGRGWVLDRLKTCGRGLGCNEFVFTRGGAVPTGHATQ